jgi:hypothetical protein
VIGEVALAASVVIGIAVFARSLQKRRKKNASVFGSRTPLSLPEIASRYYSEYSSERVAEMWSSFGRCLRVDPRLLRPTDRLGVELAAVDFSESLDDPLEDLEEYAQTVAKETSRTIDFSTVVTLDDLMRSLIGSRS